MFNLRVDIRQALYRSQDLPERSRVGLNDLKQQILVIKVIVVVVDVAVAVL